MGQWGTVCDDLFNYKAATVRLSVHKEGSLCLFGNLCLPGLVYESPVFDLNVFESCISVEIEIV